MLFSLLVACATTPLPGDRDAALDQDTADAADSGSTGAEPSACDEGAATGLEPGMCSPGFSLPDRDGNIVSLSMFRGQGVLVDLAAVWCQPCWELAPELQDLYEARRDDGFVVVTMLTEDRNGANPTLDDVAQWHTKLGVSYPVVADVNGIQQAAWHRDPRAPQVPVAYLVDRNGILRWVDASAEIGPLLDAVADLMAE